MGHRLRVSLTVPRPKGRALDAVARRFPRVGLGGVLADLDRAAEPCDVPGDAAGHGFTWDAHDRQDQRWWPQGVACTRSGSVLLVSWYAKRRRGLPGQGSRVSVVDRSDPQQPRYRHVLLVVPRRLLGLGLLRPVRVHAGGIAVRGDLLYVADTVAGVRVFRLIDVLRVSAGGRVGRVAARGYDYVLPQHRHLRVSLGQARARLRHSFLFVGTLDGQGSLVIGEYGRRGTTPRLVRFPLDPSTGLPAVDGTGRCRPEDVHERQPHRMQGVAVHGSSWFVSASAGADTPGDLYAGTPGRWRRHRRVLPPGPEDLDWSLPGEELWCVSEWPGRRWVFPIDARRWPGP